MTTRNLNKREMLRYVGDFSQLFRNFDLTIDLLNGSDEVDAVIKKIYNMQ
jgi:hypothetical protein